MGQVKRMKHEREQCFDLAKGLAIWGVIVGHHVMVYDGESLFYNFFWSFHMPLFFIISGYFYKREDFQTLLIKGFKGLILPYVITILSVDSWIIIENFFSNSILPTRGTLKWIWYTILGIYDCSTMAMWFLPALFLGKLEFFLLNKVLTKKIYILIAVLVMVGIAFLIKNVFHFDLSLCPFNYVHSMAVPFYLFVGKYLKDDNCFDLHKSYTIIILIIALIIVLFCSFAPVDIARLSFPLGPFNLLTTVFISFSFIFLCKWTCERVHLSLFSPFFLFVQYMGKHSLFFLCMHAILWYGYQDCFLHYFSPFFTGCLVCMTIAIICLVNGKLKKYVLGEYHNACI